MPRKPKLVTICPDCGREDVGVVLDWSDRDGNDKMQANRYRMARHKIRYQTKDTSLPFCVNGRSVVPRENVFEREGV